MAWRRSRHATGIARPDPAAVRLANGKAIAVTVRAGPGRSYPCTSANDPTASAPTSTSHEPGHEAEGAMQKAAAAMRHMPIDDARPCNASAWRAMAMARPEARMNVASSLKNRPRGDDHVTHAK